MKCICVHGISHNKCTDLMSTVLLFGFQVEETIELMMQQVTSVPLVGSTTEEAQHLRDHFIETILDPSRVSKNESHSICVE